MINKKALVSSLFIVNARLDIKFWGRC